MAESESGTISQSIYLSGSRKRQAKTQTAVSTCREITDKFVLRQQPLLWVFEFDDREYGSLWVLQDREATDAGNIVRGFHYTRAQFSCFLNFRIAIVNSKVRQPVRRNISHLRGDLIHAPGASVTIAEDRIFHRTEVLHFSCPVKQVRVKLTCFLSIGCAEFVPAERVGHVIDPGALVCSRLPKSKNCSSRILDHRHSSHSKHVKGILQERRPSSLSFLCRFVSTRYGDVVQPIRRTSLCGHFARHLVKRSHVLTIKLEHRVDHVGPNRVINIIPAEELGIESLCCLTICCCQLYPTKSTWFVFRNLLHSCFSHFYSLLHCRTFHMSHFCRNHIKET